MLWVLIRSPLLNTHSICFLREIRKKCQSSGKLILVEQMDFDYLLCKWTSNKI